ncbi:uncharacterized protein [Ptychodera flava]|uniref:uncharacterized protein n=1 Tax=Ptychodera flava TaxID=63121 RepID=UPI003969C4FB
MSDDFLDWDHLEINLDDVLKDCPEYDEGVLDDDVYDDNVAPTGLLTSENRQPAEKRAADAANQTCRPIFVCPVCGREYLSISGFRGHVKLKHDRPELKAYNHKKGSGQAPVATSLKTQGLFSSPESFEKIVVCGVTEVFSAMMNSEFLALGKHGSIVKELLTEAERLDLNEVSKFLTEELYPLFHKVGTGTSLSSDYEKFFANFHAKRCDKSFMDKIANKVFSTESSNAHVYCQVFLRELIDLIIGKQSESMAKELKDQDTSLSQHDQEILAYIAGYIIHALQNKYWKSEIVSRELKKLTKECTQSFKGYGAWLEISDRGGLKYPSNDFFLLIRVIENKLRQLVDLERLSSTSMLNDKLLEDVMCDTLVKYQMERALQGPCDGVGFFILESVVKCFSKIRGHAVAKLCRKQMWKERSSFKQAKADKKSLRGSLKDKNH